MATKKQPKIPAWLAALGILLGVVGGGIVASTPQPPAPPATTTAATTTAVPPTTLQPVAVRRYFADQASWNQLAAVYGPSPTLQPYAERWWDHGGGGDKPGSVNVAFGDYSIPTYRKADATTIAVIYQATWAQALYTTDVGVAIPWNPKWTAGTGTDNLLSIVDDATETAWVLGGLGQLSWNCVEPFGLGPNGRAGFDPTNPLHLCTTGVQRHEGLFTADDTVRIDGRGAGMPKLALTVRAAEVRSGAIRHALEMTITSTMFGPACTPTRGATAPGAGVSCGYYLPPATKLERTNPDVGCPTKQVVTDVERAKTIPEGMRFALRMTDAEIGAWLTSRGYTGQLRETARIFAVALRDYGWIVAETGCFGMHIETDSAIAGDAAPIWRQLGVTGAGTYPNGDLLFGLITKERVYVVEPPA